MKYGAPLPGSRDSAALETDPAHRSGRVGLLLCSLCALSEGIDLQAAGVAASGIGQQFHPAPSLMGTFFSASTFGLFIGALIAGHWADRIGRRSVLISSVCLFAGCSLLNATAWNMTSLTAFRMLTGLGLGGALPMVMAYVSETAAPKWQQVGVATVYAMLPLGGALISAINLLTPPAQWRTFFVVGGLVPLLLTPLLVLYLPESNAFRQLQKQPRTAGRFFAIFANGRAGVTLLLWLSFLLELLLLYLLLNWLPTMLMDHGATRAQASLAQIGFNLGGVIAALGIGIALDSRLRSHSIAVTFVAVPLLVLLLARADVEWMWLTIVVILLGCAVLAAQAYLYASAPGLYPVGIRGMGAGAAVAAGRIGSIVGPLLGGFLKSAGHATPELLVDILPLVIAGSVTSLTFAWVTRRSAS